MKAIFSKDIEIVLSDLATYSSSDYFGLDTRKTTVRFFGFPVYVKTEVFTRPFSSTEESPTAH